MAQSVIPIRARPDAVGTAPAALLDEQTLLARVVRRDRAAFEALYRGYFPRLTRFVERTVRRPQVVCEVVNDTMLVVWRRADSYNGQCKVSTWIFSIAYRTALRAVRRSPGPSDGEAPDVAASFEVEPEQVLMHRQERRILDEALLHLTDQHRAVVELTYFSDCSCREIAQIVGCPVDTVKSRLFYARRHLRSYLARRHGDLR